VYVEDLKEADPRELGGIALHGRLGRGGMGTVFYGVTEDGEPVAVKMIREDLLENSEVFGRFDRETQALGMVQSPRVANLVLPPAVDEAPPWFAVEYVRGLTLKDYIEEFGPLTTELGAALGIGLAEALTAIHEAGILHRDLKPANILLGRDGPRVIDFGLAALTAAPGDLTRTSETIGTPVCMAPEQARSPRDLKPPVDVYALGAVLTYALTGHYPYMRPTLPAMLFAITDAATLPDLSGVPEPLTAAISAMLAQSPAARPSLADVTAALAKVLAGTGLTDPGEALRQLAVHTYRERDTDPPPVEPPAPRPLRLPEDPKVPIPLVQQVAGLLRRDYARTAPF
jgi:serine/threonine protein kinase